MTKNKPLFIIALTALLDILGLGIILPALPFIVRGFGLGENWVGIAFATFSVGMFLGGMIFGRLSDLYGRKRILMLTTTLNMTGYLLFFLSGNIYVFLLARLLSGFGGSGASIAQAYIADISSAKDRTKNMGVLGAMFGIGFTLGPVLWGIFGGSSLISLGAVSAGVVFLNLLVIVFFLPDIHKKHFDTTEESPMPLDFHHHKKQIYLLFATTFITALGFSAMQSTFSLLLADRFGFVEKTIGYFFGYIGIMSVIYQAFLIKYIRRIFDEKGMILFGLLSLTISFSLFAGNPYIFAIFPILTFFPFGYGSINPAVSSLHARYAGREVGKALGTNASMMSLGNIAGPFISGYLYLIWSGMPYIFSAGVFIVVAVMVSFGLRRIGK